MGARHLGSNEHPLTHTPDGLTNDVLGAVDFRGVDEGRSQFDPTEEGIHPAAIAPDPYANLWDHYAGTAEWFQFHERYSLSGQSEGLLCRYLIVSSDSSKGRKEYEDLGVTGLWL